MRQYDSIIKGVMVIVFLIAGIVLGIVAVVKREWAFFIVGLAVILWILLPTIVNGIIEAWRKRKNNRSN